jgi:hypothetical protein
MAIIRSDLGLLVWPQPDLTARSHGLWYVADSFLNEPSCALALTAWRQRHLLLQNQLSYRAVAAAVSTRWLPDCRARSNQTLKIKKQRHTSTDSLTDRCQDLMEVPDASSRCLSRDGSRN